MLSPTSVMDHNEDEWRATGVDLSRFSELTKSRFEAKQWKWASTCRHGCGLQLGGADLTVPARLRASAAPADRGMLDAIHLGFLWYSDRAAEAYGGDRTCKLCCMAPETEQHIYWECRCILSLQEAAVVDTQHMQRLAREQLSGATPRSAYWLRGLLVNNEVAIPPPVAVEEVEYHNHCLPKQLLTGTVCTDGSGGGAQSPRLRRCSWAVVQVPEEPSMRHSSLRRLRLNAKTKVAKDLDHLEWQAMSGMLPGASQTVARSELYALLQALRRQGGDLHIWTDHRPLLQVWKRIESKGLSNAGDMANLDLWEEVYDLRVQHRHWQLEFSWVNSHAECVLDISPDIAGVAYKGNDAADHLGQGHRKAAPG